MRSVFALGILAACSGKDPLNPGTPLGAYHVEATLVSDSCAIAPKTWAFDIKLSRDATSLYWVQGSVPVSGVLGADGKAHLESKRVDYPTPDGGFTACELVRTDVLDATLVSDGATVPSFTATLEYRFVATPGTDCTASLQAWGGELGALPCATRYDLAGARKSAK